MGLDFDVKTFCQNLRATKPPYECPVKNCGKIYKSFTGIQFHLYNYDHENPTSTPFTSSKIRRKKGRWHPRANRRSPSPPDPGHSPQESLRYTEAQKVVEVDLDGLVHQLNVSEPLDIIFYEGPINEEKQEEKPKVEEKTPEKITKTNKNPTSKLRKDVNPVKEVRLPEASFRILPEYDAPDAPAMPSAYYRFIEKSIEELDEDVEYDMDEEDCAWLDLMNLKRSNLNISEVTPDTFELLMDRLEKESYFESQTSGKDPNPSIDEDAVCCICNDGECQNSNAILFCDMCNLAVHQECYGVPYIPEGQWLCRRCLQSPSRAVDCVLCPNKGGAFKQTDDGRWAHVVCALWIPEVCFANTVFLEPLDNIENIPPARWKLTCYICKQRSVGACIQCHKANCYTAFHVTCAQQAGLYMKMEAVRESGMNGTSYNVRKTAYCDVHAPVDTDNAGDEDSGRTDSFKKAKAKAKSREKMRKARKILAEKRSAVPVVSLPTIPSDRLTKVANLISMSKKQQFLERLVSYWTLKRQSRNGVPLLRRLQTAQQNRRDPELDKDYGSLGEQLQYWQRLRQDLEKARLLVELIRKREKLKREWIKAHQQVTEMQLQPLIVKLREGVELLKEKDIGDIFAKPVDLKEVPDYLDYIKYPMDFETMMKKVNGYQYSSFHDFENDFNLIVKNCLTYNSKDTVFYKAALKMREQGGFVIRDLKKRFEAADFDFNTGLLREPIKDEDMENASRNSSVQKTENIDSEDFELENELRDLLQKLEEAEDIEHKISRSRRIKQLKMQIVKLRRKIAIRASGYHRKRKGKDHSDTEKPCDDTDDEGTRKFKEEKEMLEPKDEDVTPKGTTSKPRGRTRKSAESEVINPTLPPKKAMKVIQDNTDQETIKVDMEIDADVPVTSPSESSTSFSTHNLRNINPAIENKFADTDSLSRPPRKRLRYFRKDSPPPPSLAKPNKTTDKIESSSPPTLTNSSSSDRGVKPNQDVSVPCSKGASPPILKPQVPLLDVSESESEEIQGSKKEESTSHSRHSGQKRSSRTSVSSPPKTKSLDIDLDSLEDEPTDVSNEAGTRRSTRAQTRSQSESDVTSPSQKTLRKSRTSSVVTETEINSPPKKRSSNLLSANNSEYFSTSELPQTDSFKVYRSNTQDHGTDSDDDDRNTAGSSTGSAKSSCESHDRPFDDESDDEDFEDKTQTGNSAGTSSHETRQSHSSDWNAEEQQHLIPLQPLDLVWAKCRGYPWYPALIIDPDMPSSENCHNGVPIPIPPEDVLTLKDNYEEDVFLVLFFDTKRTWQWLPRYKLEPLGVDTALDKARLVESKKATERKAVKKAYENAIIHRCRVTGESTSISGDSGNDN